MRQIVTKITANYEHTSNKTNSSRALKSQLWALEQYPKVGRVRLGEALFTPRL